MNQKNHHVSDRSFEILIMKLFHSFISLALIFCIILSTTPLVFSQQLDYLEDEGETLWEEQQFLDSTGREFETQDQQYIGEDQAREAEEAARISGIPSVNIAEAIEKDKKLLPDNILYGVGTGVIIGGWLALQLGQSARENVKFLSVGILTGVLLGIAVGTKSLYSPKPQIYSSLDNQATESKNSPLEFQLQSTIKNNTPQLGLNLQYKF